MEEKFCCNKKKIHCYQCWNLRCYICEFGVGSAYPKRYPPTEALYCKDCIQRNARYWDNMHAEMIHLRHLINPKRATQKAQD